MPVVFRIIASNLLRYEAYPRNLILLIFTVLGLVSVSDYFWGKALFSREALSSWLRIPLDLVAGLLPPDPGPLRWIVLGLICGLFAYLTWRFLVRSMPWSARGGQTALLLGQSLTHQGSRIEVFQDVTNPGALLQYYLPAESKTDGPHLQGIGLIRWNANYGCFEEWRFDPRQTPLSFAGILVEKPSMSEAMVKEAAAKLGGEAVGELAGELGGVASAGLGDLTDRMMEAAAGERGTKIISGVVFLILWPKEVLRPDERGKTFVLTLEHKEFGTYPTFNDLPEQVRKQSNSLLVLLAKMGMPDVTARFVGRTSNSHHFPRVKANALVQSEGFEVGCRFARVTKDGELATFNPLHGLRPFVEQHGLNACIAALMTFLCAIGLLTYNSYLPRQSVVVPVVQQPAKAGKPSRKTVRYVEIKTKRDPLTVRSGPGKQYRKVGTVPKGSRHWFCEAEGQWALIASRTVKGWVSLALAEIKTGTVQADAENPCAQR